MHILQNKTAFLAFGLDFQDDYDYDNEEEEEEDVVGL